MSKWARKASFDSFSDKQEEVIDSQPGRGHGVVAPSPRIMADGKIFLEFLSELGVVLGLLE